VIATKERPPKPADMPVDGNVVPRELRDIGQWIVWKWKLKQKSDGTWKWDKPPQNRQGFEASAHDADNWLAFDDALDLHRSGKFAGVGFALTADDPFVGVDLDGCRDPETGDIKPEAQRIIDALASYSEVSPSRTGVKIFVKATIEEAKVDHDRGIEIYRAGRYFTVTGAHVEGTPLTVEERTEELTALLAELFPRNEGAVDINSTYRNGHSTGNFPPPKIEDIESALAALPPRFAHDTETWAGIGHALYRHDSSVIMCGVWDRWSQQSENYDEQEISRRWSRMGNAPTGAKQPMTLNGVFYHARANGWRPERNGHNLIGGGVSNVTYNNGPSVSEARQLARASGLPSNADILPVYQQFTMAELAAADYRIEYLVDRTLVAGQPCLMAGGKKTLKTSFLVDLGISIAMGSPFLGKLDVLRAARVALMSGESGLATLQEPARRVALAKGYDLADIGGMIVSPDLPICGHVLHMEPLQRFLRDNEIEVLILDPAYLCLPTEGNEGSLFAMGALLRSISEVCQGNGVTLVLAHHTRKNVVDPYAPVELEDIAWAGFPEFARQWLLLSRREKFQPGTGEHRLWMTVGGSAGHSSLWGCDVAEGVYDSHTARQWNVTIWTPDQAREAATDKAERARQVKADEKLERDKRAVLDVVVKMPNRRGTKSEIRDRCGRNGQAFNAAFAALVRDGHLVECEIAKGNRKAPYEGFMLREIDQ
jgi:hypothetical protein